MEITDVVIVAIISAGVSIVVLLVNKFAEAPMNQATVQKTNAETIKELWVTVDAIRKELDDTVEELKNEREARQSLAAALQESERIRREMSVIQAGMDRQIKALRAELRAKDARISELERKLNGMDTGPLSKQ